MPGARDADAWTVAPHVLVVEDSPVNQLVVSQALQRIGCRSEVVADGERAVAAVQRERYDAVLMDCNMPIMDGFEATAAIRRLESDTRHVPIIAMTARAMDDDRTRCLAAGMDDYISKPLRRLTLEQTLHRWIPSSPRRGRDEQSAAA